MRVWMMTLALLLVRAAGVRAQEVVPPVLLSIDAAEYAPQPLYRGIEADIPCELTVGADGDPRQVTCAGTGADAGLARAARDALRTASFKPATILGKPVEAHLRYTYRFAISRERLEGNAIPFEPAGEVTGEVLEAGKRRPIPGADVLAQGLSIAASTDGKGRFSIKLPRGRQVLVVSAADYVRQQFVVEVGGPPQSLYVRRSAVSDLSLTVPGERETHVAPTQETVTREELRNVPGTQGDPVRVIENLPGLARAPYSGGQLIVRGAPAIDTGAYIDGQRIPILYHLLNGPSVLGEEMVERIDLFPGGAGVFYGRNLAGVVAVQSRHGDPDKWHGSLAADLQKSAAFLQGPIGDKAQLALGVRRSYINPAVKFFADPNKELTLPVYWDYQARGDIKSGRDRYSLTLYGSDDSFEQIGGGRGSVPLALGKRIGFHRARLAWERRFSDAFAVTVAPMFGLDLNESTSSGAGPGVFARPQSNKQRTLSAGLRGEAAWKPRDWLDVRTGVDVLVDRVGYDLDILYDLQLRGVGAPNAEEARLNGVRVFSSFAEYVEGEAKLGRLRITPGLRFEQLHWIGHTYAVLDPRLWLRYAVTDSTNLFAYGGLYHQAPSAEQVDPVIGNPAVLPQAAEQAGAGFEHQLNDLWSVKAEGYVSLRRSLVYPVAPSAVGDGTYDNPLQANTGQSRSVGLEVLVRRQFTEKLYGWLAYTLSRSREQPRPGDDWRPTPFDQPHILTFLVGYRPSPYVEFATRVRVASGNPLAEATSATFDADSGNYVPTLLPFGTTRLPTFVQVDFEVNNIWAGDYARLQLYIDFQNLLNRRNAEAQLYDFRYQESDYVHGLPFLASVGAKVSF